MRRNPRHISRCETHPNDPWDMEIRRTSEGFEAFIDGKSAGYIVLDIDDETEDGLAPGQGSRLSTKGHDVVTLPSTVTVPELRGRGVGSALVKAAVDFAESEGLAVHPVCPFVVSWLEKHPECTVRIV